MRALRQLGFDAERIGEPYLNEGGGRRYAVLSMPAIAARPRAHACAKPYAARPAAGSRGRKCMM